MKVTVGRPVEGPVKVRCPSCSRVVAVGDLTSGKLTLRCARCREHVCIESEESPRAAAFGTTEKATRGPRDPAEEAGSWHEYERA